MSELISVIVPVYNTEECLDRCILSILNQTYKNLEIILVDDGSDDRSGAICDSYGQQDDRIKVLHTKNKGPSYARNCGLNIARGDYIGFIDSDDYVADDMYEKLLSYMERDVDITSCATLRIAPYKKDVLYKANGTVKMDTLEAIGELLKSEILCFSACDKLFRKGILKGMSFRIGRLCEDLPFTYQAVKRANKVVNIGQIKYFYCRRENSRSSGEFTYRRLDYIFFTKEIYKDICHNYPTLIRVAERRYLLNIYYIITQIEDFHVDQEYSSELERLKKTLWRMRIRVIFNPEINKEEKKMLLKKG